MELNTLGIQTKLGNLVEFDYETWRKFRLDLYWPAMKDSVEVVWPVRILTERIHPVYQMIGLIKLSTMEEIVLFDKETGKDNNGRHILMDLDTPLYPVQRAKTFRRILWNYLKFLWTTIRIYRMIIWKEVKNNYHERKRSESST